MAAIQQASEKPVEQKIYKIDPSFKYEVVAQPGGETLMRCFQCGKCEASCPVERFRFEYRPAQIIRGIMLGLRDWVIESPTLWLCATCFSCTEYCPQDVHFTEIMRVLRRMAIAQGKGHPYFIKVAKTIAENGKLFGDPSFINEMRSDIGLPPVTSLDKEEVLKLIAEMKACKPTGGSKGKKGV